MSGWEVIACKEEQRFCSAARAVQTADAYRCESDSEEGSSTVALSQRSGDGVDANPFSLWWSGLLKEATAEAGFRPHSTCGRARPYQDHVQLQRQLRRRFRDEGLCVTVCEASISAIGR